MLVKALGRQPFGRNKKETKPKLCMFQAEQSSEIVKQVVYGIDAISDNVFNNHLGGYFLNLGPEIFCSAVCFMYGKVCSRLEWSSISNAAILLAFQDICMLLGIEESVVICTFFYG
jgi:hypothetical protein